MGEATHTYLFLSGATLSTLALLRATQHNHLLHVVGDLYTRSRNFERSNLSIPYVDSLRDDTPQPMLELYVAFLGSRFYHIGIYHIYVGAIAHHGVYS